MTNLEDFLMEKKRIIQDHLGKFFWDFKRMDNTVYNLIILNELYKLRKLSFNKGLLIKPIITLNISIIECIVFDFMKRIKEHTQEKIPGLSEHTINLIKNRNSLWKKKPLNLNHFLPLLREYNLLNIKIERTDVYDDLVQLNSIRNRIHIQNEFEFKPRDEKNLYTNDILDQTEFSLMMIITAMMKFYPRPWENTSDHETFPYPWEYI